MAQPRTMLRSETTPIGAGEHMDGETRKEWEYYCALAEIEEDQEKFVEISRNIVRILDEKQVRLNRQRPASGVRYPTAPFNVA